MKTQINLRIRAVCSDSSQSIWRGFESLVAKMRPGQSQISLIVLGFNDTSTLVGHFVSSPREREKRDRRDNRWDEREGKGRKREMKENEGTEGKDSSPCPTVSQYQLDAPVTKATGHLCLNQPPLHSDQTTRMRKLICAGHMSEGTFSDVAAQLYQITEKAYIAPDKRGEQENIFFYFSMKTIWVLITSAS